MIKNIKLITRLRLHLLAKPQVRLFSNIEKSERIETLKTYLEIIPPHKMYEIVQNK